MNEHSNNMNKFNSIFENNQAKSSVKEKKNETGFRFAFDNFESPQFNDTVNVNDEELTFNVLFENKDLSTFKLPKLNISIGNSFIKKYNDISSIIKTPRLDKKAPRIQLQN